LRSGSPASRAAINESKIKSTSKKMLLTLNSTPVDQYRGRLAPSPTGWLHLGHARTFWTAYQRCRAFSGTLVLRNEDLDRSRCRPEFVVGMIEDLHWFGLEWQEGPDCGGPFAPYSQSERFELYRAAFRKLRDQGCVYPCTCSRQDVLRALAAPHAGEDEPIYPGTCRPGAKAGASGSPRAGAPVNWRFRVPDGQVISFHDGHFGKQEFTAGADFGDFVVWRHDDSPSYQLAVVVDDSAMQISEVVRGGDLLRSTSRQILLYQALELKSPAFFHCELMTDAAGVRLAKRHDALSLKQLRTNNPDPAFWRQGWNQTE
jgi:glutamyl-tRNA synthetase